MRRQLTLFVPAAEAARIEAVRRLADPVQHRLIAAHVTLCRDEETDRLADDAWAARLSGLDAAPLVLHFGAPQPFAGHGWLMPCTGGQTAFRSLRQRVLGGSAGAEAASRCGAGTPQAHAHLTLAHPRNPASPVVPGAALAGLSDGCRIRFAHVSLITQAAADVPWRVVATWPLGADGSGRSDIG